jgi:hypothetical protein
MHGRRPLLAFGECMSGCVLLGAGALTLVQVLWYEPFGMARTRTRVALHGDPSRFDTFLASRWYRRSRWARQVAGAVLTVLGLVVLIGGA